MNILVVFVVGLAVVAFGPWFLLQAIAGYVIGAWCGSFAAVRMRELHCEICRVTGDKASDIDDLAAYVVKASKIGGLLCPVIPLVSIGVGMYCSYKSAVLRDVRQQAAENERRNSEVAAIVYEKPCFSPMGVGAGVGVRL